MIRIATVSFFSIGFIQYFQRLWYDAFENEHTATQFRYIRRVVLLLITVGMGLFIHYGAMMYIHNDSAILYHNWALFVLTLPLLFGGFNKLEVTLQTSALLLVWYMHHAPNLLAPVPLASLMAFVVVAALFKVYRQYVMQHWWFGVAGALVVASLFWFTVPPLSMGMHMDLNLELQAVLLYTLMLVFVLGYWLRQYREDRRNRERERLADYEKGSHANSYANHLKELQALFATTKQDGQPLSFATLDLDRFKQINDRFGHLAGNAVLIGVTETLKRVLVNARVDHKLYLTTGEEFNLVFPNLDSEAALPIITACWQAVRKRDYAYEDRTINVTMSVGITDIQPQDRSVNDIYKRADDALSKSKRSRDAIVYNNKVVSGTDHAEKRLADYQYFSQGVYDLAEDSPKKAYHELLLRTYDPLVKRWILPDSFEIPAWMSIALLQDFMRHTDLQNFNLNLTAAQFQDLDIANALTQFAESPEGPANLTVEIMDLTDSQTTRRISAIYRAAGMKILIDDVGSDNSFELVSSSLPYINGIKFAMQNLRKTTSDAELRQRVEFWQAIAQDNQLSLILEGIETAADLAWAKDLGIRYGQGYYFGKPAQAEKLLSNN
ncbi:diguanylate cyclase domain-containing protein [Lacticaseibacillus sp. GG6-2]